MKCCRMDISSVSSLFPKTQCGPFIILCLGSIGAEAVRSKSCYKGAIFTKDHVIKGQFYKGSCYKGAILQRNYWKMTIQLAVSYNSFVKCHGKKIGSRNMTMLYPNLCYKVVCFIVTALYPYSDFFTNLLL